ncbi:MAG: hypothetical protein KDK04_02870 [Candidatus Competibacteraceae bacterium]|nr:hypothetical protein [Candidatus Competibacteraceae bacterium]
MTAKKTARSNPPVTASKPRKGSKVNADRVRQALADGHTTPARIAEQLGATSKVISNALGRYVKQGLVIKVGKGQYGLSSASSDTMA